MKKYVCLFLLLALLGNYLQAQEQKLWYKQPASNWNEALPVGNGRPGAMVFGKVYNERIQVNEIKAGNFIKSNKRYNLNHNKFSNFKSKIISVS